MTREEREKREHRERLRATFDQAAGLYGRARPGYPPALFDDLADLTGIRPGSRVLEIGPGTGQATLPLAERGGRVVAVELGPTWPPGSAADVPSSSEELDRSDRFGPATFLEPGDSGSVAAGR
jgi:SAM-dependent methyltransferase